MLKRAIPTPVGDAARTVSFANAEIQEFIALRPDTRIKVKFYQLLLVKMEKKLLVAALME
ncbi:MAG: hypothetical protein PUP92_40600 [Rhizonema sp. PD38]|nr:hypothetical protein [Rhizonema sp. PD38]